MSGKEEKCNGVVAGLEFAPENFGIIYMQTQNLEDEHELEYIDTHFASPHQVQQWLSCGTEIPIESHDLHVNGHGAELKMNEISSGATITLELSLPFLEKIALDRTLKKQTKTTGLAQVS